MFHVDKTKLTSDLTVRFRTHDEFVDSLKAARFRVDDLREAPDRRAQGACLPRSTTVADNANPALTAVSKGLLREQHRPLPL